VNYNVHSAIGKISSIPAKFGQHLTFAIDALAAAAAPFANLVGQANPAMITQFSLAVRDAYGTLGQQLVPVMRTFTDVARKIGNMFAGMQGTLEPAFRGIKSFVESVGNTLTRVLKDRAPLIQYLATAIERTAKMAAVAIDLFFRLADVIVKPAMRLLKLLEFDGGFDASKSAVGAGFRSVKTVSASKEIADEAIKGALMAGIGQQQYERPESYLKTIAEKATAIEDWLKRNKLPTSNKEVAKELRTGDGVSAAGAASASPTYNLYRTQKRR
jgi:hypothetical protein